MNEKIKMLKKIKIFLPLCIVLFLISLIFCILFSPGTRKLFIYESIDGDTLYSEAHYIPRKPVQGDIAYFVDELLLGPTSDRYRPLFATGTKALSCFIGEDKTLYINLSEEAVFQKGKSSKTSTACYLLEKNVLKNYNAVDNIIIFMMGNRVE